MAMSSSKQQQSSTQSSPHLFLKTALQYASIGWRVFPCIPGGKKPRTKHGFKDASTDPKQILAWWTEWPTANIGVSTGEVGGITVLDVDIKAWEDKHGDVTLDALIKGHGELPGTVTQQTWSGGLQHVFSYVPGVRNSTSKLGKDLDVRGEGGYIVAPPSFVREKGEDGKVREGTYAWTQSPFDRHPAEMPAWLVALLTGPRTSPNGGPKAETTDWAALLAGAPEGQRHAVATRIAGHFFGKRVPPAEVVQILLGFAARCAPPFPADEATRIVEDLAAKDARKPPTYRLTDTGNGLRFAAAYADRAKYSPHLDRWLTYDGHTWIDDVGETAVLQRMKALVENLFDEAKALEHDTAQQLRKWAVLCGSVGKQRAALEAARSEPAVVVDITTFDQDDWILNMPKGVLDLRTCTLRSHHASDRCRLITRAEYYPDASDPKFTRFINEALPNPDTRKYYQTICGYMLIGDRRAEIMVGLFGPPQSGKSTAASLAMKSLGTYATAIQPETFMESRRDNAGEAPRPVLASLVGKRLVISPESRKANRFDAGLVKQVTGGNPVTASAKYKDPFMYTPKFLWLLHGNHRPQADFEEHALRRRIVEIPFKAGRSDEEADDSFKSYLLNTPGVWAAWLAWAVEGLKQYLADGQRLKQPAEVRGSTREYWTEQDVLGPFMVMLVFEKDAFVTSQELAGAFTDWALDTETKVSKADLNARLVKAGCVNTPKSIGGRAGTKQRGWRGVRLAEEGERRGTVERRGTPESENFSSSLSHEDFTETGVPRRSTVPQVQEGGPPLDPGVAAEMRRTSTRLAADELRRQAARRAARR